jgi:hypothetical protein
MPHQIPIVGGRRRHRQEVRHENENREVPVTTQVNGRTTPAHEDRDDVRRLVRRKVGRVRRDLADAVDDKVHATRRGVRRGVHGVEDGADRLAGRIRSAPLRSVLLGAAAGVLIGAAAPLIGRSCRARDNS